MIEIAQITHVDENVTEAFARLMPQLSPDGKAPDREYLQKIADTENAYLFAAYNPAIAGTLTLIITYIPTGAKAWIEDVVVDSNARGQNIGKKLVRHATTFAESMGVTNINLTSSPERVAANRLYQKIGFVKRETNVYRLII
ncbi:MAG: GNAT family N-acetyltransferase [Dysgonomonas sp.]